MMVPLWVCRRRLGYHAPVTVSMRCCFVVLAVALTLLAGCQSCRDRQPPTTSHNADDAGAADARATLRMNPRTLPTPTPMPTARKLTLLAPGATPRRVLRYAPAAGVHAFTATVAVQSREYNDGAWSPWGALPALRYRWAFEAADATAAAASAEGQGDGDAGAAASAGLRVLMRGDALEIDPAAATATEAGTDADTDTKTDTAAGTAPQTDTAPAADAAAIAGYVEGVVAELRERHRAQIEGRMGTAAVDERGRILGLELDETAKPGTDTRAEMLQRLAESVVPLPEEEVGVGARWQAQIYLRRGAGLVTQNAVFELLAVDGDTWRVRAEISQDGERQIVSGPQLPPSWRVELLALVWRASGELTVSPRALTPIAGELAVEYRVHSRLEQGPRAFDAYLENRGTVTLQTTPPTP